MYRRLAVYLILSSMLVLTSSVWAEKSPEQYKSKNLDSGWSFAFENDLLAGGARDKDFTYGLNLTRKGERSQSWFLNPLHLQKGIDRGLGLNSPGKNSIGDAKLKGSSVEFGLYGFTPDDISQAQIIEDDRPYASLIYMANTRDSLDIEDQSALSTTLSVGVLGLDLVGSLQNELHDAIGGDTAQGWENQISSGGELTARYTVAKQQLLPTGIAGFEAKTTSQVSVGYITEATYSLGFRKGRINSNWWEFDPELTVYGENTTPGGSRANELYFWGGLALKARAHNSFLQGQFRHSQFSYDFDELNHILLEAWAGVTLSFAENYRLSYLLRSHSSEIKEGAGDRSLVWGGVVLSRDLN